jgi:hypothetical protein
VVRRVQRCSTRRSEGIVASVVLDATLGRNEDC